MFSIGEAQSQGDTSLGELYGHLEDQCFVNQDFVDFIDSFNGNPVDNTNMNSDLKELLADVLAAEEPSSMDFSLLSEQQQQAIPAAELSYDLSSLPTVSPEACSVVPVQEKFSYDTSTHPVLLDDSYEVSQCADVSSTNLLFDLADDVVSSPVDDPPSSEGGTTSQLGDREESVAGRKYLEMRRKNNVASQRSRKIRKQKNSKMAVRLLELERENGELTRLADQLEKEKNSLQELLMNIIAKKS